MAQVEAAVARMREALVPLNEQLHGLAAHISTMRSALAAVGRASLPPRNRATLEAALAAAEATYTESLRTRDTILRQAHGLQSQAIAAHTKLGSLATRESAAAAALSAEESVRLALDSLSAASSRLEARLELTEG
jgi:hypothetical protein